MIQDYILKMLESYGQALSDGKFDQIAQSWAVPALVLSDQGAMLVSDIYQVEKFFAGATEWYHQQGVVSTRPEIVHTDVMTEHLVAVDVRWPSFDADGVEKMTELSHYILEMGADSQLRIRLALIRTAAVKG
ncbi:MAG TPA: hypothetical protein VN364_03150 [Bellilinea sp.]|nr:hypothetical protein [Bellilinea sp.]